MQHAVNLIVDIWRYYESTQYIITLRFLLCLWLTQYTMYYVKCPKFIIIIIIIIIIINIIIIIIICMEM